MLIGEGKAQEPTDSGLERALTTCQNITLDGNKCTVNIVPGYRQMVQAQTVTAEMQGVFI